MRTIFAFCLLVASVFLPYLASADENTVNMEEVTVTATRYEEQPSEVPADITIITREDISKSTAQNIPELLRTEYKEEISSPANLLDTSVPQGTASCRRDALVSAGQQRLHDRGAVCGCDQCARAGRSG